MLDLAERITTMVEAGLWTADNFPSLPTLATRHHTALKTVHKSIAVLATRQVLHRHRIHGNSADVDPQVRWLPGPQAGPCPALRPAARRIFDAVITGLGDGTWTPDDFPPGRRLCAEMGWHSRPFTQAMRALAQQGVMHLVVVQSSGASRRKSRQWQPVQVQGFDVESTARKLVDLVRRRELHGLLPAPSTCGDRFGVGKATMTAAYELLAERGLFTRVWAKGFGDPVWLVVQLGPNGVPGTAEIERRTKAEVVADDVAGRLSEWRWSDADGHLYEVEFPSTKELAARYRVSYVVMKAALEILVGRGLLVRMGKRGPCPGYVLAPVPAKSAPPARHRSRLLTVPHFK